MIITSKSPIETKKLAGKLLKEWLADIKTKKNSSLPVCLEGELGGGKTTFAQGIAEALGIKEPVTSPTFLIMKKYQTPRKKVTELSSVTLYHFDCYRINDSREILDLGWEEIINRENNIILIEWAEKIKDILPKKRLNIKFEFINENTRKIKCDNVIARSLSKRSSRKGDAAIPSLNS